MTGKRVAALFKRYLQAHLPGMDQRGSLIYQRPIGDVLRACHFESSAYSRDLFVVHAFVQPLYRPRSYVVLSWGERLGLPNERWFDLSAEPEEAVAMEVLHLIQEQALPLFAKFRDPSDFVRNAPHMGWVNDDQHFLEAMAYSLALCGKYDEARAYLRRLLAKLQAADDLRPYQREMIRRDQQLDAKFKERPEDAITDLRSWRQQTLRAIRLNYDAPTPDGEGEGPSRPGALTTG